eukprot:symbB.v1.2.000952.t1/scaffold45.1/size390604/15
MMRLRYVLVLVLMVTAEGGNKAMKSRQLQDQNVTFTALPPKIQYPIDPAAMITGSFVGALGVPLLFGIWAFFEKRKPGGGALGAMYEKE